MTSIESVQEVISKHFEHVKNLGNGVLRGERVYKDKPYAVAYVDLSDAIVERSHNLTSFQENLLGAEFFSTDSDLRWNSYLYFLAGPKSVASDQFREAKARIEADRHFARKFVLEADDLVLRLREPVAKESPGPVQVVDVGATWAGLLRKASLGSFLDQPPRKTALEQIASGDAFKAEAAPPVSKVVRKGDPLANGFLRNLTIGSFRRVNLGKPFTFGDINLIVGANGTGKTSLLEAIEALYCGRVRRDPDAPFTDIIGTMDNGQGTLEPVRAPTTVPVLKARNTLWYGRTDFQANAISQGFSRFNFLDTDAAFRLSSDSSREDIRDDLAKLLVGPETSKLWEYLSKLSDDVRTRLRSLNERLPDQSRAVELLTGEVNRLREAPSEASTLLAAYRDGRSRLAPAWPAATGSATLDAGEREKLDALVRTTRQVQSAVSETPVTREKIVRRVAQLREGVAAVKALYEKHEAILKRGAEARARLKSIETRQAQLEQWLRLLEAGVPALTSGIRDAEERVSRLRPLLPDQPGDTLPPVPAEYAALGLSDAQELVWQNLGSVQDQERDAELALSQSIQLGQSLEALRRDLHDAAVAYIEQSGEAALCPVCKTEHSPAELVAKLEALVASQGTRATESLRRNAQMAREQAVRHRQEVTLLAALAKYAEASGVAASMSCGKLQDDLRRTVADLSVANIGLQTRRSALSQLDLQGVDWTEWERTRDSTIAPLLPPEADPMSEVAIKAVLGALREQASSEAQVATNDREQAATLIQQITDRVSKELDDQLPRVGLAQQITVLERALRQVESALLELDGLARLLQVPPTTSIEDLQVQLESCLLTFDRAQHALQADAGARVALEQKTHELKTATANLAADTITHGNLLRASEALSTILEQYSLERATADAFGAIKDKVSSIFAQIHSPQEYDLGDFTNESLVIRRDNNQAHAVNQVSTGQRAALALSIFLALNDNAKSAPPVILIDDPVAHIDDLNTLSFLDYLREIVLRSPKQIFFATADIRLAALFQRKFEFMGSDRFKRISLPLQS
jgi:chromosome segregation protein